MSLDVGFDTASIPYGVIDGQRLPRVVAGHKYHVCATCSATLNTERPFCFLYTSDEGKATHAVPCDACAALAQHDRPAYRALQEARTRHLNLAAARELFHMRWPVLPTLPATRPIDPELPQLPPPAAPPAPPVKPQPDLMEIAILATDMPTRLRRLKGRERAYAVLAFLAYAAHGAQADAVYVPIEQLRRHSGMRTLTIRRAMLALEGYGYAAQVTRKGRVYWRLYLDPTGQEGAL